MNDESIPYRSPAHVAAVPTTQRDRDEEDYSTLVEVRRLLDESIINLYKDFNAFDTDKNGTDLEVQIGGRKYAYEILVPLQSLVDSAIKTVDNKQRG